VAQLVDGTWVVSAQDVISESECQHKVALDAAVTRGHLTVPKVDNPALKLLQEFGLEFEKQLLEGLESTQKVKRLEVPSPRASEYHDAWEKTKQAMDEEYEAIYQGTLYTGDFIGFVDFLIPRTLSNGEFERDHDNNLIYEPVDAKSSRSAKKNAVIQVAAYAEALTRLGRPEPKEVHLWLSGDKNWSGKATDLMKVAREYRERVQTRLPQLGSVPEPIWAPPCGACAYCRWAESCDQGRREARDLSLIQEIRATTRVKLIDSGITTIDEMAAAYDEKRPKSVSTETFTRLQAQAAIQIQGEQAGEIVVETTDEAIVNSLPPRSQGDLWFDMEGDPYANQGNGLEYMFGFGYLEKGEFAFETTEATDTATERKAFEDFVDFVTERWSAYPDMHIYHYANYERNALLKLAQKFGSREDRVDLLLRNGVLVDLYKIVRSGFRFSTEKLSIKHIEEVYGMTHSGQDVASGMDSVIQFEEVMSLRATGHHDKANAIYLKIREYNKLDCKSTLELDTWIRTQMTQPPKKRPTKTIVDEEKNGEESEKKDHPSLAVINKLTEGIPADPQQRSNTDQSRMQLAATLDYHAREQRPTWWNLFDLIKSDRDDLEQASGVLLANEVTSTQWASGPRGGKPTRTLTVTNLETAPSDAFDKKSDVFLLYDNPEPGMRQPADSIRGYTEGASLNINRTEMLIKESSGPENQNWESLPIAILPGKPINTNVIANTLLTAANEIIAAKTDDDWNFPNTAWADLLLARAPRRNTPLPRTGHDIADITQALKTSDSSYVAVQGPPGTGKTYIGSHIATQLANDGWKIGVVAQSHSVINNFLAAVATRDAVPMAKKPQQGATENHTWDQKDVPKWAEKQDNGYIIGGTVWNFCTSGFQQLNLDLLVIDEAGQFALPNAIAAAFTAKNILLLGDPQQLPQVSQAAHPENIQESVLAHVSAHTATMPENRGYFLNLTYRMHPALTEPISHLQYDGKLHAAPITSKRHLKGINPGITPTPVQHHNNTTSSKEEAKKVVELAQKIIGHEWSDAQDGATQQSRLLEQKDIIVVAAFNAQVRLIRRYLDDDGLFTIKVGTVDKFQGQEAVAVIVSMATSTDEDLPRGIDFLLSPNRLNVAISRAQWVCYLVHSPALRAAIPTSIIGLQQLGSFLGLLTTPNEHIL
jgi:predicted RecB family nuclease